MCYCGFWFWCVVEFCVVSLIRIFVDVISGVLIIFGEFLFLFGVKGLGLGVFVFRMIVMVCFVCVVGLDSVVLLKF